MGSVGLIFQSEENELSYNKIMAVTGTVFTKRKFGRQVFKKNCHGKLCENSSDDLIVEIA